MTEQAANKKASIIFVCTGNTCRSPMAEFLFKDYLKQKKRSGDFFVTSAGLVAERGAVMSDYAAEALDMLGIKHNKLRSARVFTVRMSMDGDVIVAMSDRHAEHCDSDNAVSFEQLIGTDIPDPYGGILQDYVDCAKKICSAFDAILDIADKKLAEKRSVK